MSASLVVIYANVEKNNMAKVLKTQTILADQTGLVYAQAQLSEAQIKRLIKEYKRAGIFLTAHGSPDQIIAQVNYLSEALAC